MNSSMESSLLPINPKIEPKSEPLDLLPTPQTTPPLSSSSSSAVLSEFHRIQNLFNTAFSTENSAVLNPQTGAIVPVDDVTNNHQLADVAPPKPNKKPPSTQRSSELVRVADLTLDDHRRFRDLVRKTRILYDSVRINSVPDEGRRARGDLRAAALLRRHDLWLNRDKRIVGPIPGVYVGDVFFFRMELCVVGLHGQVQAGIDYLPGSQCSNGEPIATSIIVSGGYEDDEDAGDVIIYTGHGGQDKLNRQCAHQKLEGGNLALERSMYYGIEVRVVRGMKINSVVSQKVYVYDGLYRVLETWLDVGKSGFGVFKFKLARIEGQPEMGSSLLKFAESVRATPLSARPRGYLSLDFSKQKECVPVRLFNDIDDDQDPLYFEYLRAPAFPAHVHQQSTNVMGCQCINGCNESCVCAMKNGGEFPYDHNGCLLKGKPVVFECGTFCRCPPSCRNRLAQNGMKHRLEVFRSMETGWGVRSLDLIHAGAFICEYAGVILTREQAQIFSMNGDSLIYPHRFADKWAEWGDLSQIDPDYVRPTYPAIPPIDFAIDVSKMRNVTCYMSQSTTPNVMVQFVLYDHNNLMFPHLMLFAMENIPPMMELSLDYGVVGEDEWKGNLAICN